MAIMTIRDKNQVTLPAKVLAQSGLRKGDPIEFEPLPNGGIAIYPLGTRTHHQSAWDFATELARQFPGIEDTDLELPPRNPEPPREIEW